MRQLLLLFTLVFTLYANDFSSAIPEAKKFDWMQLKSGEWLKGELKGIYSGVVEFDSDELDLITIDFEDVNQILTAKNISINVEGQDTLVGKLHYKDNSAYLTQDDGTLFSIKLDDIATISGSSDKESDYWSANIFIGLDFIAGNTKQTNLTVKAHAQRRSADTRLIADYIGINTIVDDNITTAENDRLATSFDIYQTAHFYWRAGFAEYLRDPFQNINLKYTLGVGVGYDIIYTPQTNWSISAGPGYQKTTFEEVTAGENRSADTAIVYLDTAFDTELTSHIDFIVKYRAFFLNEASGSYTHHAETSLQTELISDFDVDITFIWDRTEDPIAFGDGSFPKQDDYKLMFGVGYSY